MKMETYIKEIALDKLIKKAPERRLLNGII